MMMTSVLINRDISWTTSSGTRTTDLFSSGYVVKLAASPLPQEDMPTRFARMSNASSLFLSTDTMETPNHSLTGQLNHWDILMSLRLLLIWMLLSLQKTRRSLQTTLAPQESGWLSVAATLVPCQLGSSTSTLIKQLLPGRPLVSFYPSETSTTSTLIFGKPPQEAVLTALAQLRTSLIT